MTRPQAEHPQADLMSHCWMAHTSTMLLLNHNSLKRTGSVVEEDNLSQPQATRPLFAVLLGPVQPVDRVEVTQESVGSPTHSQSEDAGTADAISETVEDSNA